MGTPPPQSARERRSRRPAHQPLAKTRRDGGGSARWVDGGRRAGHRRRAEASRGVEPSATRGGGGREVAGRVDDDRVDRVTEGVGKC